VLIELLVGAGLGAGAALVARRLRSRGSAPGETKPARAKGDLEVSDVVLYLDQEFWLAGCVRLIEEQEPVASLFRTPGADPITWLAELGVRREIVLFEDTAEVPGGHVGDELPIGGRSLRLSRRGRATLTTEGEQLPVTADSCEFALMQDGSGRRLLVIDHANGTRWALLGEYVGRELLDILPGSSQADESATRRG